MIKVGIIGATGYTGGELIRILAGHNEVEIKAITSRSNAGKSLEEVFGNFAGWKGPVFSGSDSPEAVAGCDLVFLAVPHGVSMGIAPELLKKGIKVIDLGADFRFREARIYEEWYRLEHPEKELTKKAVYGLPELYRNQIRKAKLLANPGCYPTSVILGCYPLLTSGLVQKERLIIAAKSGVSGAGRKAELSLNFSELFGNFKAYGIAGHRHTPEIEQELSQISGEELVVSFTPHLLPITRGILSTIYLPLKEKVTNQQLTALYEEAYQGEPFVKLCKDMVLPEIKNVAGTNCCQIGVRFDERTQTAIIISVIDNMGKGASGQAVQNMNIMCDLPETMGLVGWPVYPQDIDVFLIKE